MNSKLSTSLEVVIYEHLKKTKGGIHKGGNKKTSMMIKKKNNNYNVKLND